MRDTDKTDSKMEIELLQLLDYYIRKIEYSHQIRRQFQSGQEQALDVLRQQRGQLSDAILQSVKRCIKEIRLELKDTEASDASGIQPDFMEELDLFQARHGLEEKA